MWELQRMRSSGFTRVKFEQVVGVRAAPGEGVPHSLVAHDRDFDAIHREDAHEAILEVG